MRPVVSQPSLPLGKVSPDEIARKRTLGDAIGLCAEVAGINLDKQASADIGMDKAQWSRIQDGREGIKWDKLARFLDAMGNDVPLLWMLHQRGYDIMSVRRRENELERQVRERDEKIERLELKLQALADAVAGRPIA